MGAIFNGSTTASEVLQGRDLTGKTFLVTGSSAGLGAETARVLAMAGAAVVMVGRDKGKNEAVAASIESAVPGARLSRFTIDLSDLADVRRVAEQILGQHPRLDCLINNAGFLGGSGAARTGSLEPHLAINHLGPFLLTNLLLPALKAAAPSRIVLVASNAHRAPAFDIDDLNFERRGYDHWAAYAQSKRATVLHAVALARRLAGTGVTVNVLHPGVIETEVFRHMPSEEAQAAIDAGQQYGVTVKSVAQGAATQVWAATAPELKTVTGTYLEDCQIAPHIPSTTIATNGVIDEALDPETAERLWAVSERMIEEELQAAA